MRQVLSVLLFGGAAVFAGASETTESYDATVTYVKRLSQFKGRAHVLHLDARWVVGIRKADGTERTFAIHSPAQTLGESAESALGKKMRFNENATTDDWGRVVRREWARARVEPKR